jgi:hypothetical protein
MANFIDDPVDSVTRSLDAPAVRGESRTNEGMRGISHSGHSGVVGINVSRESEIVRVLPSGETPGRHPDPRLQPPHYREPAEATAEGNGGWSKNAHHGGVVGVNTAKGVGVYGTCDLGVGVWGTSRNCEGVYAQTHSPVTAAIAAYMLNPHGVGAAIYAENQGSGVGVFAKVAGGLGFSKATSRSRATSRWQMRIARRISTSLPGLLLNLGQ